MPFLALLLLGLSTGTLDRELAVFERSAEADIRSRLQGDQVLVSVRLEPELSLNTLRRATIRASRFSLDGLPLFTEPKRSKAGRLKELRLELTDFTLRGLKIRRLEAVIPDCRFDLGLALARKGLRLSQSGTGVGTVEIGEKELAAWIDRKYAEIKGCTVRVDRDVVWVEGYGEFLIVKSNFQVISKLQAVGGTKLTLTDAKIYFDWQRAEPSAAKVLLQTLNPVVDLAKDLALYDAVNVSSIRLRDGFVRASGKTRIPLLPADHQG